MSSHLSLNKYILYNCSYPLISYNEREVACNKKAINCNNDYLASVVPELKRTLRLLFLIDHTFFFFNHGCF